MAVTDLFNPLPLMHGTAMKNRFMLAPLTNQQSEPGGQATPYDIDWIGQCGRGGYALVQTCAATVHETGKTFLGQLGIHSDEHLPGLTRMAQAIREGGALSAVQIHHGGHRARRELGGTPTPASEDSAPGVPALTERQVMDMRDSFVEAARRAERAGFDGVAVHGAFGFMLSEFLSPDLNRRTDRYGGAIEDRSQLLFEVIDGIRKSCRPDFQVGLRLSIERFGLRIEELREVAAEAFRRAQIDYLDLALWDSRQIVREGPFAGKSALSVFADLPRGDVKLGATGKIMSARRAAEVVEAGCDFVLIGRAAILHSDFPERVRRNPNYESPSLPVSEDFLREQGVSPPLINYMRTWEGFVRRDPPTAT